MIEWLSAAIESVPAGWRELSSKDALILVMSVCSFLIAIASFASTIRSRRLDATTAARNDLHSCISEISKLRTEREGKERQLGEKFYAAEHVPIRVSLTDRINLYLSKAVLLSTSYRKLDLTSFDNLLLGSALADEGKYRTSLRFHKRAVKTSADPPDKAKALRVYGQALIASGRPRWGRWRMRKAAKLFSALSRKRGYDEDKMNYESAETYARLVQTQLHWNYRNKTRTDLIDFNQSISRIKDRVRRQSMEEVFAGIAGSRRATAEPASGVAADANSASAAIPASANGTSEAESKVATPVISADDAGRSSPVISTAEMNVVSAILPRADIEQRSSIGR